jgi:hypothetical protein
MYYTVDESNRIIDVDDDWDASVARAAGTAALMRARIVGRALEDFMTGDATKMFVRAALDAARLRGETRVWPYRCDTPDERRRYDMVICPQDDGMVKVEHRLVSAEPRARPRRLPAAQVLMGWRCSQCLAVRHVGTDAWVEGDVDGLLAQDVCPSCASRLFDTPRSTTTQCHE